MSDHRKNSKKWKSGVPPALAEPHTVVPVVYLLWPYSGGCPIVAVRTKSNTKLHEAYLCTGTNQIQIQIFKSYSN